MQKIGCILGDRLHKDIPRELLKLAELESESTIILLFCQVAKQGGADAPYVTSAF